MKRMNLIILIGTLVNLPTYIAWAMLSDNSPTTDMMVAATFPLMALCMIPCAWMAMDPKGYVTTTMRWGVAMHGKLPMAATVCINLVFIAAFYVPMLWATYAVIVDALDPTTMVGALALANVVGSLATLVAMYMPSTQRAFMRDHMAAITA